MNKTKSKFKEVSRNKKRGDQSQTLPYEKSGVSTLGKTQAKLLSRQKLRLKESLFEKLFEQSADKWKLPKQLSGFSVDAFNSGIDFLNEFLLATQVENPYASSFIFDNHKVTKMGKILGLPMETLGTQIEREIKTKEVQAAIRTRVH